jgi:hypothetical protein
MRGNGEVNNAPAFMSEDEEYVEHLKTDRRQCEEID